MSESQSDDGQEKSHDPTPSRIQKARDDGDVAQSKEANAAASYLGFYLAIALASGGAAVTLGLGLSQLLRDPATFANQAFTGDGANFFLALSSSSLKGAAAFFLLPLLGVLASLLAQQSITFSMKKIKPKMSRLSLVDNAKKKYGPDGLAEFAKSSTKLIIVCILFGVIFASRFTQLPMDSLLPAQALPEALLREGVMFAGLIVIFSVAIALIDLPWTQHQHTKKLKMTFEEIKKELKEQEGDPTMKQSRRERGQAIARNQMMKDVPDADVIIVNPTHYAVALKWDRVGGAAPVCVAKGTDEIALKIREVAALSGVPIHSDPPTARALHATVDIGDEIDRDHYAAVAAAIHFADTMRKKARANG